MKIYVSYVTAYYCLCDKYKTYGRTIEEEETGDYLNITSDSVSFHSTRKTKISFYCL
jgi:hypothetical protein